MVEVDQAALWRFLWWSGTMSIHVLVDQNREDHSVRNCCRFLLLLLCVLVERVGGGAFEL